MTMGAFASLTNFQPVITRPEEASGALRRGTTYPVDPRTCRSQIHLYPNTGFNVSRTMRSMSSACSSVT